MAQRTNVRQLLGPRAPAAGPALPRPAGRVLPIATAILGAVAMAGVLLWALTPREVPPALPFGTGAPRPLAADPPPLPDFAATDLQPARDALGLLPAAGLPRPEAEPLWRRDAVTVADPGGRPMIAVVIDDLGLDRRNTARVTELPGPLTLAFMTYAGDAPVQTRAARAAGHELLVHVPMAPEDAHLTTGPNVLNPDLAPDELARRIDWALSRFDGYVGINNHMGSRFTADRAAMSALFDALRRRGLLFLDSRTTAATVGEEMAMRYDLPFARRNIFLDNETSAGAVWAQLGRLEAEARRTGAAVGIGHPHDGTIDALRRWLPTLAARGFALVPVSAIARHNLNQEVAVKLFFGPEAPLALPSQR
jgi:hypothetical protein